VLALLAVTVAVGVRASTDGTTDSSGRSGFPFGIVAVVQGADVAELDTRSVQYELIPNPVEPEDPLLERRGSLELPTYTPLPTPVAPPPPPPAPSSHLLPASSRGRAGRTTAADR
jgi:hypothetical protein